MLVHARSVGFKFWVEKYLVEDILIQRLEFVIGGCKRETRGCTLIEEAKGSDGVVDGCDEGGK